jgi:hypothetical protein
VKGETFFPDVDITREFSGMFENTREKIHQHTCRQQEEAHENEGFGHGAGMGLSQCLANLRPNRSFAVDFW